MGNKSNNHQRKLVEVQRSYRRAVVGLICGAIATIIAWVMLSIDIFAGSSITGSAVFAGVMSLIFILNIVALDSTKKKLSKYPGMGKSGAHQIAMDRKEKAKAKLEKQKKKNKSY